MRKLQRLKIDRPILSELSDDHVLNSIENFSQHTSVLKIKQARNSSDCFFFKLVTIKDICKEILALDAPKSTQSDDMPIKFIRIIPTFFSIFFQANLNNPIETSTFPEQLKYADVKLVFRQDSRTDKKNYRVISILSNVSKIHKRCLNKEYFQAL